MRTEIAERLGAADRDAMLDLWVAAWRPTFPDIDFVARRPWFCDYLDGLLAAGAVLLLRRADEGALRGFATLDPAAGRIDQLAVDPAHAGQGHATALLDTAKTMCPSGLTLSVNQANTRAARLYARHGFAVTGDGHSPRTGLPIWFMRWGPAAR